MSYTQSSTTVKDALEAYCIGRRAPYDKIEPDDVLEEVHKAGSPWIDLVAIRGEHRIYISTRPK